jgi:tripartite-type tricarboxylate transporter receptor subunit TctC
MANEGMRRQLTGLGIEPTLTSPEEFGALIRSEIPKWARIVKASGAQID